MAGPVLLGPLAFPTGLSLYASLNDLMHQSAMVELTAGSYDVGDHGRWEPERHGYSDGYYFELLGPDGAAGWQWQGDLMADLADPHDVGGVDDVAPTPAAGAPEPAYAVGKHIHLDRDVLAWRSLSDLQRGTDYLGSVEARGAVVLDRGFHALFDDNPFDYSSHGLSEPADGDELEFWFYLLGAHKKKFWITEWALKQARLDQQVAIRQ